MIGSDPVANGKRNGGRRFQGILSAKLDQNRAKTITTKRAAECSVWGSRVVQLSTLALDYDGTIAQKDVLDPDVRGSCKGVVVLLVTRRILEDLRWVAATCTLSIRLLPRMAP